MDRRTQGRVLVTALCCLAIPPGEGAAAALPAAGARYAVHDHRTKGAGWHVELEVSKRDPAVLRTIVVYDDRCDETVAAERVRLTPDGVLDAGGAFTATGTGGKDHAATWELHARFVTPQQVEGSFRIVEPDCEASKGFVAPDGSQHRHLTELGYPDVAARRRPLAGRPGGCSGACARSRRAGSLISSEHGRPGSAATWLRDHRRRACSISGAGSTTPTIASSIPGASSRSSNCLPVPELERALHPFTFGDVPIEHHEAQPCRQ